MTLLTARALRQAWSNGALWQPVVFFLLVATLFPFAVGPDGELLRRTGGGVVIIAVVLAALLPMESLIRPDHADGTLDQLAVRGITSEVVALSCIVAHTLAMAVPVLLALVPAAGLLRLDTGQVATLAAAIALMTPGLASLTVTVAALTVQRRGGTALSALLVLPLAVPMLIFAAGALDPTGSARGALKLLAALSLVLFACGPLAAGAALRAARD